ncbi:polysaccharide deacetylase family protein [Eubacteriales bacterium OttesenSCG-928-N14]|nr:polysaccharide deacetylase family protein [Eubacteriales bacterium OttesenSCG-928-N14]
MYSNVHAPSGLQASAMDMDSDSGQSGDMQTLQLDDAAIACSIVYPAVEHATSNRCIKAWAAKISQRYAKYAMALCGTLDHTNIQMELRCNEAVADNGILRMAFRGTLTLPSNEEQAIAETLEFDLASGMLLSDAYDASMLTQQRPRIALSFDDGPSQYTDELLDLLEYYDIPATFFMMGQHVGGRADTVARMPKLGCEVANHTWNHPDLTKLSDGAIASQAQRTNHAVEQACGVRPRLLRPPYGASDRRIVRAAGMKCVGWNLDTLDWRLRNADAVYARLMELAKDGSVVLLHDTYRETIDAMYMAIPDLILSGYDFVVVSEIY